MYQPTQDPRPSRTIDLVAYLATLASGPVVILAAHVPSTNAAMILTTVCGVFKTWTSIR